MAVGGRAIFLLDPHRVTMVDTSHSRPEAAAGARLSRLINRALKDLPRCVPLSGTAAIQPRPTIKATVKERQECPKLSLSD